ncbi:serine protease [Streptomyces sp. NBC_01477]|uniref:serine protease n=1 Tax=Streptomyces sp. NBC_01477 TaxID=2976015 RepID=UPI002E2FEB27|nr:serine protease [Streptomyces sp. NBC_01477]
MEADGGIGIGSSLATPPWAVRLRRANGKIAGSGILLSPDRVLTCAHVVGRDEEVTAEFVGATGLQVPRVAARVTGGAYRPEKRDADGDPSGDVALLELDRPRPAAEATTLHRVSAPGREVRMYGFPAAYNGGLWLPATIVGGCGRDGQVQLRPPSPAELARPGFSGGGVVDLATDRVIGMVLASAPEEGGGYSFMSPAETVVQHLPEVGEWTVGQTAVDEELRSPETGDDRSLLDEPFAERLARWLRGDARIRGDGAARQVKISLVPDADPARAATLRRAITLADRELRSRVSTGRVSLDAPGTVPAAGGLDLALQVSGRGTDEVAERIARRMGLWQRLDLPVAERIAAARVTITLVVVGVDAAADPASLLDLLALLVARGSRVLLVFRTAGAHFARAREELLLRPAQERRVRLGERLLRITGAPARELDGLMARVCGAEDLTDRAVDALIHVMAARAELTGGQGAFAGPPDEAPDLAGYERMAARAEQRLPAAIAALRELRVRRDELRGLLGPYRRLHEEGAARGENLEADDLYLTAHRLLYERPCRVPAAEAAVRRFLDLVDRPGQPPPDGPGHPRAAEGPARVPVADVGDRHEGGTPS